MTDQAVAIRDREALLRVYELFREAAGPSGDEYALELAMLDKLIEDFELAEEYAESGEQVTRGRAAKEAALGLREAIRGLSDGRRSRSGLQTVDAR